jgi:tight adherence protein B
VLIAVACCFVGILGLFFGIYWLFVLRAEGDAEAVLARRLKPTLKLRVAERVSLLKQIVPLSSVPVMEQLFARSSGIIRPLEKLIEGSGLSLSVGKLVLACGFLAALSFVVTSQLTGALVFAFPAAVVAGVVPVLAVRWIAMRRLAKFEEQFPEAIDLIARGLRAGHALTTALGMVAEEAPEPVRGEFRLLYDRQNFGMQLSDALKSFAARVPLLDARFFATSVLTARESGGNLGEVLDNLSALIRERFRLKRHVRAVSAHGRMTGLVLSLLPMVIAGLLAVLSPGYISILFTDSIGKTMVVAALVMQAVGALIMRRIIDIEI